jgi:hypothetical protein
MRPVWMLLAGMGVVALVMWRLRGERPDLLMAAQKRGPDEPTWIVGQSVRIGGPKEPGATPRAETELERFQWQRKLYLGLYPHLGEVLQLDAAAESDLYDLLARQGLDFRGGEGDPPEIQDRIASEKDAELEKLLGEHAFRRFDQYRGMPARGDVGRLNAGLGEAHRIRGEAIWRLVQLIHDNSVYGIKGPLFSSSFQTLAPEVEGSPRSQALITLAQQQDFFRTLQRWQRTIEAQAATFLTPVQCDALKRSHAETSESWRRGIEQLRTEVGLTPGVPELPEATLLGIIRRRIPVEQDLRAELTVMVNGESVRFEHTGPNRERFGFQAGSGLRVEAVPTLYDDGSLEMLLAYFETRRGKPRQLDQWVRIVCQTRQQNGAPNAPHDADTETHRGLMEYKIRPMGITATALERR